MTSPVDAIAFDADDTLWLSERHFRAATAEFCGLLAGTLDLDPARVETHLLSTELRNLEVYGYGAKSFTLGMVEAALELSGNRVGGAVIARILAMGREVLAHPVELVDDVEATLEQLARDHRLVLVTKGDLLHQGRKLAASGLADRFDAVEIVADKDVPTWTRILHQLGVAPDRFVMVGDSLRSDIVPVLALGGWAIHLPGHYEMAMETAVVDHGHPRLRRATTMREVPALIASLGGEADDPGGPAADPSEGVRPAR